MADEVLNYRFDDFLLDVSDRQLWRGDVRVDLNARYFDALALLVREHGQLVEKDRFFTEVWEDVVVSDSALTQCIKEVRKQLGDDASSPRYIQTVPRYGYRFVGPVEVVAPDRSAPEVEEAVPDARDLPKVPDVPSAEAEVADEGPQAGRYASALQVAALWGVAGTVGGGIAGMFGGLLYGAALAFTPAGSGLGTASILAVLLSLNMLAGLIGGFGVSFGLAAANLASPRRRWSILGAALGGLIVGGVAKVLGVDAFNLLFGRAPTDITGGLEGAALGAALALGARLGGGFEAVRPWGPAVGAGVAGAVAGTLIAAAGGHLMGGSLALLARSFDGSRLQLDALGRLFGEGYFGHTSQMVLSGVEGLLFGSCVVGALLLARRGRLWSDSQTA